MFRRYGELIRYSSFLDRYNYLRLYGNVAAETFGGNRYLNQQFYRSSEWKQIRDYVIIRDSGCDLGVLDRPIYGKVLIHHMNPVTQDDVIRHSETLLNPEYLICVSHNTHNAIHYGDTSLLIAEPIVRKPRDTCLWGDRRG